MTSKLNREAQILSIYIGENDHWRSKPLYIAILELLRSTTQSFLIKILIRDEHENLQWTHTAILEFFLHKSSIIYISYQQLLF